MNNRIILIFIVITIFIALSFITIISKKESTFNKAGEFISKRSNHTAKTRSSKEGSSLPSVLRWKEW